MSRTTAAYNGRITHVELPVLGYRQPPRRSAWQRKRDRQLLHALALLVVAGLVGVGVWYDRPYVMTPVPPARPVFRVRIVMGGLSSFAMGQLPPGAFAPGFAPVAGPPAWPPRIESSPAKPMPRTSGSPFAEIDAAAAASPRASVMDVPRPPANTTPDAYNFELNLAPRIQFAPVAPQEGSWEKQPSPPQ